MIFLFLLVAETIVLHVLLDNWSSTAAWVATAFSIYFALQIVAHLKALRLRPIVITDDELLLRCGIFGDTAVRLNKITHVEKVSQAADDDDADSITLTPLGQMSQPNVRIELKDKNILYGIYGIERRFTAISFFVDDPERLMEEIKPGV